MTVPELPEPALSVRLFGPLEVCLNGHPLPRFRFGKTPWLLALLALRHGAAVERDWLIGLLWPESSGSQAFRNCLTDLRRALGNQAGRLHSPTPHTLGLDLSGARADIVCFDAALGRGDPASLEEAAALYRGPLLEGCSEEWAFQERQSRERAYLAARERLAALAFEQGETAEAERHLRQAVAVDPLRDSTQRALMQVLAAGGNYAAALLCYRELRLRLHRELNSEPDAETQTLFQQLRGEARRLSAKGSGAGGQRPGAGQSRAASVVDRDHVVPDPRPLTPSPTGTVTFLFTDIEGSTRLWEQHPDAMRAALLRHDTLLRDAIEAGGGVVFKTFGDQFCAAFAAAPDALAAALAAQRALHAEPRGQERSDPPAERAPGGGALRGRMALHTGTAEERDGDYFGPPLNRVARLLAAAHGGQILLSFATVELVRDPLPDGASLRDLGERRLQDLTRPERIFQLVTPDLPADFPPLRSLEAFPHNLPLQLTSFIGREEEIAQVKRLLAAHRLLTLTGAGGCGKTRLALQVAGDLLQEYRDGVRLVELAPLADAALVPQAVAAALEVWEEPGSPLVSTLARVLRARQLLLVLDNCEHLVDACARLAEALLQACPELRVLATTREALGIPGERAYRVPSLSMPGVQAFGRSGVQADTDSLAFDSVGPERLNAWTPERLMQYEAVRLFLERAETAVPGFAVTNENAPAVAQVCHRLDGIPLAIELAAVRVKLLSPAQIAERLDDRFRLLTGGSRTALPRQQTLRALIDWSYDLLSEGERTLLRRLSVFAGGWTLGAAEAVCAGESVEAWELLDLLTSLVDKSLVTYDDEGGEGRYRLLETVRQYARDRLLEAGEGAAVRTRHLEFFLNWAEQWPDWERMETEHDNLRAALAWTVAQGQGEAGLRLGGALGGFWNMRGYGGEGREHLAGLLALPGAEARTAARAKALNGAGMLARHQGDYGKARALLEESLAIFWELGVKWGIAYSSGGLGWAAHAQGDYGAARALSEESLAISRELGNKPGIAWSLRTLGRVAHDQGEYGAARAPSEESLAIFRELGNKDGIAWLLHDLGLAARDQGDYAAARALIEESLALLRELGIKLGIARSLNHLGLAARDQGDYGTARALHDESLAICRELGDKGGIASALGSLGRVAHDQGNCGAARALLEESLTIFRELGHKRDIAQNLEGLAAVAVAQAQSERAARLLGASQALRETLGAPLPPVERPDYERQTAIVRSAMGEEPFAAAWAEGRAMALEQALAYALEEEPDGE